MSAARARKVLIAAIAISLLFHLLLAGYIRWPFLPPADETEIVNVRRMTVARIVPHTPPPAPVPTPRVTPATKAKVIPPALTARGPRGPRASRVIAPIAAKTPAPPATPAPTPAATAMAQACLAHDISPAVAATPPPVEIPPQTRASKVSGTAAIRIEIGPQGNVTSAAVSQSSGSTGLDAVAMQMAKSATYTPALVKCKPVASTYTFTVKFVAW